MGNITEVEEERVVNCGRGGVGWTRGIIPFPTESKRVLGIV